MSALGSLVVKLALEHAEYTHGLDKSSQAALQFAKRQQQAFDKAELRVKSFIKSSVAGFAAITAGFLSAGNAVSSFRGFNRSLAEVSTLTGGTAIKMGELEAAAKSAAQQFGTPPIAQTKAFYDIISAGAETSAEAIERLHAANKLAIGGVTDVGIAADGLTSILNAYGNEAESAEAVSDTLFVGMKFGKTTIGELASEMGKVSPIAASLNVSLQENVATIAALTKQGISTTEAVTGLRAVLAAIAKPSSEAVKIASQLGFEFNAAAIKSKGFAAFLEEIREKTGGSTEQLAKLFGGVEALVPIMALAGQAGGDFNRIMSEMDKKAGSTDEAFTKMSQSDGFKVDRLMAAIDTAALKLGATLSNVLSPAIETLTDLLNGLPNVNVELTAIDRQKQLIAQLNDELEHTKGLQGVFGFLGPNKRDLDELEQKLQDATDDLAKMEAAANKTTAATQKVFSTNFSPDSAKPIEAVAKSRAKSVSESQRFLESLKKEAAQLGKTTIEIRKMEAAQLGVSKAAEPLIDQIETITRKLEDERKAAQSLENDLKQIAQITESVATADERFIARVEELDRLLEKGLGPETYTRALQQAREEIFGIEKDTQKTTSAIEEFWIQAARNSQTALSDGFFKVIKGDLDGLVGAVKNTVKRIIAEFAALKTAQALGLGGLFGTSGTSATASGFGGLLSAGKTLLNNFSTGLTGALSSSISSLGTLFGSSALTSFSAGLGASPTAIAAAQGAATLYGTTGVSAATSAGFGLAGGLGSAVPIIGGALIADQFLKPLFGDKTLGGTAGKVFDHIPVLGTLINGLFGRGPYKDQGQEANFSLDSTGLTSGTLETLFKSKGSLFSSTKRKSVETDLLTGDPTEFSTRKKQFRDFTADQSDFSKEIGKLLDETIRGMSQSIAGFVKTLGGNADIVESFSTSVSIASEKGKAITEEQIVEVLDDIGNQFALHALPIVADFTKHGEDALDALQRISVEYEVLTQAAIGLGNSAEVVKNFLENIDFAVRSKFIDDAGGVDKFSQQIAFFTQNFVSAEEKLRPITAAVTKELDELGLGIDISVERYKALVQSFGHVNGISQETFFSLLDLQPAFLQVNAAMKEQEQLLIAQREALNASRLEAFSLSDSIFAEIEQDRLDAVKNAKQQVQDSFSTLQASINAQRDALRAQYDAELDKVTGRIKGVSDSVRDLSALSDILQRSVDRFEPLSIGDARSQIAAAIGNVRTGRSVDTNDIGRALSALENQSTAGFTNSLDFAKEQIKSRVLIDQLANATDSQLTLEERTLAALESQRDRIEEGFEKEIASLDNILGNAQAQLSALTGINTSVLSVSAALAAYADALAANKTIINSTPVTPPVRGTVHTAEDISRFIEGNLKDPFKIYTTALREGLVTSEVANSTHRFTVEGANRFQSENGLVNLDVAAQRRQPQAQANAQDNREIVRGLEELRIAIEKGNASNKTVKNILLRAQIGDQPLRTEAA